MMRVSSIAFLCLSLTASPAPAHSVVELDKIHEPYRLSDRDDALKPPSDEHPSLLRDELEWIAVGFLVGVAAMVTGWTAHDVRFRILPRWRRRR
jgi:hypothetical protein